MQSIRHIGVYVPIPVAADPAAARADFLAAATDAQITVLVPREHADRPPIERLLQSLRAPSSVVYLPTASAGAVRDAVESRGLDILLKTARPLPGSDKVVGGVARDLLRRCPCPLWIVRHSQPDDRSPVIAAVSELHDGDSVASKRVIRTAAHIAITENRPLVVAHAWIPFERALWQRSRDERRRYVGEHRRWLREKMSRIVAATITTPVQIEIEQGHPSKVLPALAARLGSETIVVGHRGRRGLGALFLGNTGEDLIEDTQSGVVSVRAA